MFLLWIYLGRLLLWTSVKCKTDASELLNMYDFQNTKTLVNNKYYNIRWCFKQPWAPLTKHAHTHSTASFGISGGRDALITLIYKIIWWYICVLRTYTGRESRWQFTVCNNFYCWLFCIAVIKWKEHSVKLDLQTHFMKSLHYWMMESTKATLNRLAFFPKDNLVF